MFVCPGEKYEGKMTIQFTSGQESLEFVDLIVLTGTTGFISFGEQNIISKPRLDIF